MILCRYDHVLSSFSLSILPACPIQSDGPKKNPQVMCSVGWVISMTSQADHAPWLVWSLGISSLVGGAGCAHLEQWWSGVRQWEGWHPINGTIKHVWNHQQEHLSDSVQIHIPLRWVLMLPADQPYSLMKLTRLPAVMANLGYPSAVDPVKRKGSLLTLGSFFVFPVFIQSHLLTPTGYTNIKSSSVLYLKMINPAGLPWV